MSFNSNAWVAKYSRLGNEISPKINSKNLWCLMDLLEGEQMGETEDEKISTLVFADGQSTRRNISYCEEWNTPKKYESNRPGNIENMRNAYYDLIGLETQHLSLIGNLLDNLYEQTAKRQWVHDKATNFVTCELMLREKIPEWVEYTRGYRIVGKTIYLNVANADKGKDLKMFKSAQKDCQTTLNSMKKNK